MRNAGQLIEENLNRSMPNVACAMLDKHKPVLLQESIEALDIQDGEIFLDGTLGGGGHSEEVLRRFPTTRIIGLDRDPEAVKRVREKLNIEIRVENFRHLDKVLEELEVRKVDAILLDLGLSSDQLETSGRGFSFLRDEPLDMRMSNEGIKAKDLLNSWDQHAIELVLHGFGEERDSRKIAEEIVRRRGIKPFETTFELVEAVLKVKPRSFRDKIHPATKTFQALRIAVNEELTNLEIGLEKGFKALEANGRFVVISFHSLEDRIVKNFFRDKVGLGLAKRVTSLYSARGNKPITASMEEIDENPRSRSAKLRVIEKI